MNDVNMHAGMNQRMAASASMQLGARILQAGSMELEHIVSQALEKNPVLEQETPEEEPRLDAGLPEMEGEGEAVYDPALSAKRDFFFNSITEKKTLAAFLHEQAETASLSGEKKKALSILIDSLDSRGFFEEDVFDIAARHGITRESAEWAWHFLREMEPSGVGAMDLRDSLLIQLEHLQESSSLAARLVRDYWEDIVRHRYGKMEKETGLSEDDISEAISRIGRLNPDPGSIFSDVSTIIAPPDIIVEKDEQGNFDVRLTGEHIPRLKLSDFYKDTLSEHYEDAELREYLKKAFKEGRELIHAISQRQETILRVAKAIAVKQIDYFNCGIKFLKPINMESLASDLNLHVSTVSRAVSGKTLLCRWGVRELKSFFTTGISSTEEGHEDLSASAVGQHIREIIDSEDKRKPLSDAAITKALEGRGIKIARRTVAKYREQLKILPASIRREVK